MGNFGIILKKSNLKKRTFTIFDNILGKIECLTEHKYQDKLISNGTLIEYQVLKWRSLLILKNIEILIVPNTYNYNDLLFLHHILEICLFFIPIHYTQNVDKIFNTIKNALITIENKSNILEKFHLLKELFIWLEIHPNEYYFKNSNSIFLISSNIDNNLNADENRKIMSNLKSWLIACLNTHPFAHKINTASFLNLLDNYE